MSDYDFRKGMFAPTITDNLREGDLKIGDKAYFFRSFTIDVEPYKGQTAYNAYSKPDLSAEIRGGWIPEEDIQWEKKNG